MKIGIITFHWATNYGAVIQTYALQEYLKANGHNVYVVNYKPRRYDWFPIKIIIKNPRSFFDQLRLIKRERIICQFRKKHLVLTKRYRCCAELMQCSSTFDAVISGSDQVLNPHFTIGGEGKPSDAYFIGFADDGTKKIGYAVSFGCSNYPIDAKQYATKWIRNFDMIGVRESSGLSIVESLNYKGYCRVVPDPTILLGKALFANLQLQKRSHEKKYVCIYLLGNTLLDFKTSDVVVYIDERHRSVSIEDWLSCIRDANFVITNSYHGMLMAILFHTTFAVIKKTESIGQNDRLTTVLEKLGLLTRMVDNNNQRILSLIEEEINWEEVDNNIDSFRQDGADFLNNSLNEDMPD